MDQQSNWILELVDKITKPVHEVTGSIDKLETAIDGVENKVSAMGSNTSKAFDKSNKALGLLAVQAGSQAIQSIGQPLLDGAAGTYEFNASLKELEGLTGVTNDALGLIGDNARQTAKDLGGDASKSLQSYTVLLSKLTPEIAKNPDALAMMGKSVGLLGETMKGDLVGATNSASSAMNQFGVDLTDPLAAAKEMDVMLNQMVASAKVGSQDVPVVAQALDQVGAVAKNAGVSFVETNAALQVLGKYGKEGAEGGVALRNVLSILSKQDFLPKEVLTQLKTAGVDVQVLADKSKPLADRISELKKLGGNDALLGAMFGQENTVAITGLLGNIGLLKQYTQDIQKDETALADMAATMGESYQEQKDRITSYFNDVKLSVYGATGSMLPFIDVGLQGILGVIGMAPGIMATVQMFQSLSKVTWLQSAAQWALNIAMDANPIGLIIIGIAALVGLVTVIIKKYNEWGAALSLVMGPLGWIINLIQSFRTHWDSIVDAFNNGGIIAGLKRIGLVILDALLMPVQQLLQLIAKIPGLGGLAGTGAKYISDLRKGLALDEGDKKAQAKAGAEKKESTNEFDFKKNPVSDPPKSPASPTKDLTSSSNSGSAKIINMTLNVYNTYKVEKEELKNFEKITEHVVGRINDTIKDALIAAG